jgi:hypothetical protein
MSVVYFLVCEWGIFSHKIGKNQSFFPGEHFPTQPALKPKKYLFNKVWKLWSLWQKRSRRKFHLYILMYLFLQNYLFMGCPIIDYIKFTQCSGGIRFQELRESVPWSVKGVYITKKVLFIQNMLIKWLGSTTFILNILKSVQTLPKSHVHIFIVSIITAKFEECRPKDMRGVDYTK